MHATSAARAAAIVTDGAGSFVNPGSREPFHIAIRTHLNIDIRKKKGCDYAIWLHARVWLKRKM